jgi:Trk K+ transport system NAD-binding subunit
MSQAVNFQQRQVNFNRFLICGLGSLGQQCVVALKEFGVAIVAIETTLPQSWEIPDLPNLLDELIIGDCRQESVLEQAKIRQCRGVLVVTNSERVNIEAAFAARLLNTNTRLVVRSSKENLNELLSNHLGNFVAFEPTELPVAAFALATLETDTLGFFSLEGQQIRVVKHQIELGDRWCNQRLAYELNSHTRRLVSHTSNSSSVPQSFHQWDSEALVQAGDTLVYISLQEKLAEGSERSATARKRKSRFWQEVIQGFAWRSLRQKLNDFWESTAQSQTERVAIISGIVVCILLIIGTVLYSLNSSPYISPRDAFNTTVVLLLGGYDNLFGQLPLQLNLPWWLHSFSFSLTVAGTIFVGILYAMLTEKILSSKFQFSKPRPAVPQQDHVVVIGLGRFGQRVVKLLQEFNQPVVGLNNTALDANILPNLPMIVGELTTSLKKAHLLTAKSVLVATSDEMLNMEVGLMAHAVNPTGGLVIRIFEQGLSDNLAQMLPDAQVLCAYALAAEAFAAAAFGENIASLFRVNNQTILVTEYYVEPDDTLHNLLLAEVAYGYGVVPVLYQKEQESPKFMPSDDTRLAVGDRLVILATSNGLRRIEHGMAGITPKNWRVEVEMALTTEAVFEGANAIARITGCSLSIARDLMKSLPDTLPSPLYKHQAQRLVRELNKAQVKARVIPITNNSNSWASTSP